MSSRHVGGTDTRVTNLICSAKIVHGYDKIDNQHCELTCELNIIHDM